jgi:hypothetical protein
MTAILSQWYRENEEDHWTYVLWRKALHTYAPGVPVYVVDNGGPTRPPYPDVGIIPALGLLPHGRGSAGHYYNCWRSMAHGFETLFSLGIEKVIFIGQNLIVGTPFVPECEQALDQHGVLLNFGCMMNPHAAFTEYMAAHTGRAFLLWGLRLNPYRISFLEQRLPEWCHRLAIPIGPFPQFSKQRDHPLRPEDTFSFHSQPEEILAFARTHGLLPESWQLGERLAAPPPELLLSMG